MAQKIAEKLGYGWRLVATGLSFFSFGVGGLLLWLVVFPALSLLPGQPLQKAGRSQKIVHYSFYIFIGLMHKLGVMTYEVVGLDKLNRPGQLIVANHPTLIDIVFLLSRIKQASCIVKAQLWHNPFMRGPIVNAGYISNGNPEQMIAECVAWLRSGGAMVIFPEGTRSMPDKPYHFQRGAAAIALQADAIVTPVTLSCTPSTLTKAERWYQIPARRFHLVMQVGDDIALDEFACLSPKSIAVRRFTRHLQDYFSQQRELFQHYGK
ncbi:MAG: lysophospholipid acyltransferase family protein [Methylobacter sp.]|nr:lysophospholipid acyltransferase family protein [Methylobacter sp.]MDP2429297.1 lysophospholipid acyltransferase family protein [Methylobacter sp.]MDP3055769.1 lysophospholipid acyltransferase family protein [Methylobacter sp.]MDP3363691.1 lysophospholipid acyltransferase family protein [Methylobacter sp.]MDZ4219957.1 lysophospholipid acyltransferase family protein [Methylobacter sp.]